MVNCIYESRGDVFGESRGGRLRIGVALCRPCTPYSPAHHSIYHLKIGCRHPFRKPLHFIDIAVMSGMRGPFPFTYRLFYMTVDCWCIRGSSRHRHGERHRRNALPKRLTRSRDGHDAHDADIRAYSK
jgi:hypothetical protein